MSCVHIGYINTLICKPKPNHLSMARKDSEDLPYFINRLPAKKVIKCTCKGAK